MCIAILFFLLAFASDYFFNSKGSLKRIGKKVERKIISQEQEIEELLADPLIDSAIRFNQDPGINTPIWKKLQEIFSGKKLILLVYNRSNLVYWTDNSIVPDPKLLPQGTDFFKLDNAWYLSVKEEQEDITLLVLLPVKKEYSYQNEYLRNKFNEDLGLNGFIEFKMMDSPESYTIHSNTGEALFSIGLNEDALRLTPVYYEIYLWIIAFIFSYLCINSFAKHLWNKGEWLAGLLSITCIVVIFRFISIYWTVPISVYKLDLFSPEYYATNFLFPSLGDLLINLLLIHWIIYFFYDRVRELNFSVYSVKKSYVITFLFIAASYLTIALLNYMLEGLVMNSNISFDLTNILSLNIYSLVGLFILGLTLYSFFLFADILITIFHQFYLSKKEKVNVFLISVGIISAWVLFLHGFNILFICNTVFLIILERAKSRRQNYLSFPTVVLILTLFAVASAYRLNDFNFEKEKQNRQLLASKLESANDPIAEYLLEGLGKRIQIDSNIQEHFISPAPTNEIIHNRIQQLYFGGYFSKYDLRLYEFDTEGTPLNTKSLRSLSSFDDLIRLQCTPTSSPYFYYLSNSYGILTYYGKIPIQQDRQSIGTLMIELKSKYFRDDNIFPELLLEGNLKMNKDFELYSYSIYKQGKLISQQGDYPYSLQSSEFDEAESGYTFLEHKDYNHLVYKPNNEILIVVSKSNDSEFKILALFSYIFGIFSGLVFVFYVRRLLSKSYNLLTINFKNMRGRIRILFKTRIQLSMIISVILSVSIIGYITFLYISDQYNKQQSERVSQKTRSILLSIEKRTSGLSSFGIKSDDILHVELKNLSDLYLTDINIFDLNGDLIISTQPKIYEEGLISKKINPTAFIEIHRYARSEFSNTENIGSLNYLSVYTPIRNINNKTIAYLNLPYFANKSEYEKSISQFLTAFINVYVFIFVLIGFVAFFLANSITFPLTLIEEQLRETKLGKKMDPISWKRKDEIGTLINEYNRMIKELEESTDRLARSEREYAWREMAKQVAHEIKNPLTPMKLGLQYLKKSWEDDDPDFDDKFERYSKTFIEQIESLSRIASEFSNFAQMPLAENVKVDVKEILMNVVSLYKNDEKTEIDLGYIPSVRSVVLADKDQMIRTFNNLIKNAIQAIPSDRKGKIDVEILNDKDTLLIIIQDNGIGIENSMKDKIFEPNFTTKNSGMGMGLAIIYNIILNIGGSIRFESAVNQGTTFFVSLPLYKGE